MGREEPGHTLGRKVHPIRETRLDIVAARGCYCISKVD